jgi:hypothetical protein
MNGLSVRPAGPKGRGVFSDRDRASGELIERCPVLVLPGDQRPLVAATIVQHYFFNWIKGSRAVAVALGYGSLYNHSRAPNATYLCRIEENEMDFVALRAVAAGEEITVNYGTSHDDARPMWFERDDAGVDHG